VSGQPLLSVDAVTKWYAGVRALAGVSFDLHAGEVHALVGENGAGKSTLIKIMTGAVTPDSGSLVVAGQTVSAMTPSAARALGVAAIYQQPSLFPHLTIAENIAIALEPGGAWRRIDWDRRRRDASSLLERVGAELEPERLVESLSMPEQQLVEIAKAVGRDARILVMDEPTASLNEREVAQLFQVVARLRFEGVGIIYISHRLEEILSIADRVTVLRDGQTVGTCPRQGLQRATLINLMIGRDVPAFAPNERTPAGDVAIELRHVSCREAGVHDVSLAIRAGEIVGVSGLIGSGRTQLAQTMFGLTPADSGELLLHGRAVHVKSPSRAIEMGIAYLPEDRRHHGVVPEMAVDENMSLASLSAVARTGLIERTRERDQAQRYVDRLGIKAASVDAEVESLSGGNQQKVALARWLATKPEVLILDEPTQGVDVGAKAEIHAIIRELAAHGLAVLMISSELPEILAMSDRVVVMRAGTIAGVLSRDEATQERVLAMALGH
jgi:rhamnose transport system ATP-binding protein